MASPRRCGTSVAEASRIDEELAHLKACFADAEYVSEGHWVRLPKYRLPPNVWKQSIVEVCFTFSDDSGTSSVRLLRPAIARSSHRGVPHQLRRTRTNGVRRRLGKVLVAAPGLVTGVDGHRRDEHGQLRTVYRRSSSGRSVAMASVSMSAPHFDVLRSHLDAAPERLAFMRCVFADGVFQVEDVRLIAATGLIDPSFVHCDLRDDVRADIIRWGAEGGRCLIEVHSHGRVFSPASFSSYDVRQLAEWVPHVRWRLGGRPYAAMVTAADIDGSRGWATPARPSRGSTSTTSNATRRPDCRFE